MSYNVKTDLLQGSKNYTQKCVLVFEIIEIYISFKIC